VVSSEARPGGRPLIGLWTVTVQGAWALIAGWQAPPEHAARLAAAVAPLLASFTAVAPIPRVRFTDPTEGAFTVMVPAGWQAAGGMNRNNAYGVPFVNFRAVADPVGAISVAVVSANFMFQEGGSMWGMFGMGGMGGVPSLQYMPAAMFAAKWLAGRLAQQHRDLRVEAVFDRPDLIPFLAVETAKAGIPPETMDLSAAVLQVGYTEGGVALRERARVYVQRPRSAGMMGMFSAGAGTWTAQMEVLWRAPAAQFERMEPVLAGVVDSITVNPQWEQAQMAANRAYIAAQQQDILARTRQISQTLSQTSDIITSGYRERQAVHDRLAHDWSNAMLGYQDMRDPQGNLYSVPAGADQYWRDNAGYVYGGGHLVNPDPTWHKLEPADPRRG
jgi:hypothetical protein